MGHETLVARHKPHILRTLLIVILMIPGVLISFFLIIFLFPGLASMFGDNRYKQADTDHEIVETDVVYLQQGWQEDYRRRYYFTPQGSFIIPMDMALSLEGPGTRSLLFTGDDGGLAVTDYGYLPYPSTKGRDGPELNPYGLPIGFTIDGFVEDKFKDSHKNETAMLGMTCAACHTADMNIAGQTVRVEGSQAFGDFMGLFTAMDQALAETLADPAKYRRFEARQAEWIERHPELVEEDTPLRLRLEGVIQHRSDWQRRNTPNVDGGFGRVDAFGVIFNQVVGRDVHMDAQAPFGNVRSPDAPVSYPVLWDTPHMGRVQWNGVGNNVRAGGVLGRNFGQVLGVFGQSEVSREALSAGYCNTVKRRNLNAIDYWIRSLNSPRWEDEALADLLPKLDTSLVARGSEVYARECKSCHAPMPENYRDVDPDEKTSCDVPITLVTADAAGTDLATADTGVRVGAYSNGLSGLKSVSRKGETMAPVEPFVNVLSEVVTRSIAGSFRTLTCDGQTNPGDLIDATAAFGMMFKASRGNDTLTRSRAYDHSPSDPDMGASAPASERDPDTECGSDSVRYFYDGEDRDTYRTDSYRARPLNGIWASAPYLHNGSVPTLADLLEVEEDRPEVFSISKKPTFDPVRVGLVPSDATQAFQYDTRIPGNSNSGHVHGTNLPPVDKAALLEYLKSL